MDPFVGEIRLFAGNFAPRGWALCNGGTLPIAQNSALFALLGVAYGGDGRTTFGLPNLQGRAPVGMGGGPGLTNYSLGQTAGEATHTLTSAEMTAHAHNLTANTTAADNNSPVNDMFGAGGTRTGYPVFGSNSSVVPMASNLVGSTGGGQPHNNLQPYQVVNYIIALAGIFPPRQ